MFNERDFCYWLQGYFELTNTTRLTDNQTEIIKDHLNLVFDKKTPDRKEPTYCGIDKFPDCGIIINEDLQKADEMWRLNTRHTGLSTQPLC